jgi:hypothetical protein
LNSIHVSKKCLMRMNRRSFSFRRVLFIPVFWGKCLRGLEVRSFSSLNQAISIINGTAVDTNLFYYSSAWIEDVCLQTMFGEKLLPRQLKEHPHTFNS